MERHRALFLQTWSFVADSILWNYSPFNTSRSQPSRLRAAVTPGGEYYWDELRHFFGPLSTINALWDVDARHTPHLSSLAHRPLRRSPRRTVREEPLWRARSAVVLRIPR